MGFVQSTLRQFWCPQDHEFERFKQAAAGVIRQLQRVDGLGSNRMVIIGGLAVMKHVQRRRDTRDIDFLVVTNEGPQPLKAKLLALPNTPFREDAWKLVYVDSEQFEVFIDLHSHQDFPYIPREARPLGQIHATNPPYISMMDLLVFKMFSCGVRLTKSEKKMDANDAKLSLEALEKPLRLTARQWSIIKEGLGDNAYHCNDPENFKMQKEWWQIELGMI